MKLTEKNRKINSVRFGFDEPLGDKEYHNSVGDFINIVMTVQRKRGIRITPKFYKKIEEQINKLSLGILKIKIYTPEQAKKLSPTIPMQKEEKAFYKLTVIDESKTDLFIRNFQTRAKKDKFFFALLKSWGRKTDIDYDAWEKVFNV